MGRGWRIGSGPMSDDQPLPSGFAELLGTEWLDADSGQARARIPIRDDLRQPFGLMHGGVISSLVESICSYATALVVIGEGKMAMGQSIAVSFLRPVTEGHAEVRATARHRGRTTWVWDAEILDADNKLCALAQMTIAVRPLPDQA
jgi:1,4-dihydroxy-2-naphthoyl-CoA hydrolase